ncbi:DUF4013 domain-containing protein [Methanobrevibacter sp. DSM 116169]|uniref:DUF4013 domain-containing protein n=1 Tax=Methanobrevibacter sp. DSM 116169 TaxID=3242727 RepID=UPI0038FD3E9E
MNFVKLSILSLFSGLIIPFIMIQGYYYRIIGKQIETFINDDYPTPSFSDFKKLLLDGLKIIISNIYNIPVILLTIVAYHQMIKFEGSLIYIDITSEALIIFILFIVALVTFVFSKIAVANMVKHGTLKSLFSFKEIFSVIKNIGFFNCFKFFIYYEVILAVITLGIFLLILFVGSIFFFNYIPIDLYFITLSLDTVIFLFVYILIIYPFIIFFEGRAIGSLYTLGEEED